MFRFIVVLLAIYTYAYKTEINTNKRIGYYWILEIPSETKVVLILQRLKKRKKNCFFILPVNDRVCEWSHRVTFVTFRSLSKDSYRNNRVTSNI